MPPGGSDSENGKAVSGILLQFSFPIIVPFQLPELVPVYQYLPSELQRQGGENEEGENEIFYDASETFPKEFEQDSLNLTSHDFMPGQSLQSNITDAPSGSSTLISVNLHTSRDNNQNENVSQSNSAEVLQLQSQCPRSLSNGDSAIASGTQTYDSQIQNDGIILQDRNFEGIVINNVPRNVEIGPRSERRDSTESDSEHFIENSFQNIGIGNNNPGYNITSPRVKPGDITDTETENENVGTTDNISFLQNLHLDSDPCDRLDSPQRQRAAHHTDVTTDTDQQEEETENPGFLNNLRKKKKTKNCSSDEDQKCSDIDDVTLCKQVIESDETAVKCSVTNDDPGNENENSQEVLTQLTHAVKSPVLRRDEDSSNTSSSETEKGKPKNEQPGFISQLRPSNSNNGNRGLDCIKEETVKKQGALNVARNSEILENEPSNTEHERYHTNGVNLQEETINRRHLSNDYSTEYNDENCASLLAQETNAFDSDAANRSQYVPSALGDVSKSRQTNLTGDITSSTDTDGVIEPEESNWDTFHGYDTTTLRDQRNRNTSIRDIPVSQFTNASKSSMPHKQDLTSSSDSDANHHGRNNCTEGWDKFKDNDTSQFTNTLTGPHTKDDSSDKDETLEMGHRCHSVSSDENSTIQNNTDESNVNSDKFADRISTQVSPVIKLQSNVVARHNFETTSGNLFEEDGKQSSNSNRNRNTKSNRNASNARYSDESNQIHSHENARSRRQLSERFNNTHTRRSNENELQIASLAETQQSTNSPAEVLAELPIRMYSQETGSQDDDEPYESNEVPTVLGETTKSRQSNTTGDITTTDTGSATDVDTNFGNVWNTSSMRNHNTNTTDGTNQLSLSNNEARLPNTQVQNSTKSTMPHHSDISSPSGNDVQDYDNDREGWDKFKSLNTKALGNDLPITTIPQKSLDTKTKQKKPQNTKNKNDKTNNKPRPEESQLYSIDGVADRFSLSTQQNPRGISPMVNTASNSQRSISSDRLQNTVIHDHSSSYAADSRGTDINLTSFTARTPPDDTSISRRNTANDFPVVRGPPTYPTWNQNPNVSLPVTVENEYCSDFEESTKINKDHGDLSEEADSDSNDDYLRIMNTANDELRSVEAMNSSSMNVNLDQRESLRCTIMDNNYQTGAENTNSFTSWGDNPSINTSMRVNMSGPENILRSTPNHNSRIHNMTARVEDSQPSGQAGTENTYSFSSWGDNSSINTSMNVNMNGPENSLRSTSNHNSRIHNMTARVEQSRPGGRMDETMPNTSEGQLQQSSHFAGQIQDIPGLQNNHRINPEDHQRSQNVNKEILVLYHEDDEGWVNYNICRQIAERCSWINITLIHKAVEKGRTLHEIAIQKIRNSSSIIVVLSSKFSSCQVSNYALGSVISENQFFRKLVIIQADTCEPPPIIGHLSRLKLDNHDFWDILYQSINEERPVYQAEPHQPLPLHGETPFLIVKTRPSNPIDPHVQRNVNVPSTPDKRNDKRVVFLVSLNKHELQRGEGENKLFNHSNTCNRCNSFKIHVKTKKVYRYVKDNKQPIQVQQDEIDQCVKYWEDIYRQPTSEEALHNEIAFYIRIKNLPHAHKLLVYLQFDLIMVEPSGKQHALHSLTLDFETKPKRPRIKKGVSRRPHGNFGDNEDDDDFPDGHSRRKPYDHELSGLGGSVGQGKYGNGVAGNSPGRNEDTNYTRATSNNSRREFDQTTNNLSGTKPKPSNPLYQPKTSTHFQSSNITVPIQEVSQLESSELHCLPMRVTEEEIEEAGNEDRDEKRYIALERMYSPEDWLNASNSCKRPDLSLGRTYKQGPRGGLFLSKKYITMVSELEILGEKAKDKSSYAEFMRLADQYIEESRPKVRSDEKIIVLLKKCGVEHYLNQLTKASNYIREALELLPKAKYKEQLEARVYYYISTIYREKKKFGKAKHWIKKSKDCLAFVEPGEDTAKAFYNEGRLYMRMLMSSSRNEECRLAANECFKMAIEHAKHESRQYGIRLDTKLIRRCLLNMARILVDLPETTIGRSRNIVTLEDIETALNCVSTIKRPEYFHGVSKRNLVQLSLAEAGICYRRAQMFYRLGKIEKSNELITDAIYKTLNAKSIAEREGYKEEQIAEDFENYLKSDHRFLKSNIKTNPNILLLQMASGTSSDLTPGTSDKDQPESTVIITDLYENDSEGNHSGKETDVQL